ncbi:uroporphyrinogen-III synthase [Pasteurellaceae bacterium HPA106]|uniref:uroporphyrinogen-III synthase n=1 Tax=Spirabiliibacterium pneumoniae TaxID=221400 RepID=UPI001AAD6AC7|nr:uroporphyrinogen-III synthase [Spirabiliibacterium pneumoniae]MBE2897218.1 uroporphyrinogen-III synthase [Spirabiliibacterium pneumoniae]
MAILVTRPGEKGQALCELLNQHGFASLHVPLIEVHAGAELNILPARMQALKRGDGVLAVSQSAVRFAHKALSNVGFRWRDDVNYFTVGAKTAQALCESSQQAVHYPYPHESSEGLLAQPHFAQFSGQKMLILRGNGGRELLTQQLRERGITVECVESYQRIAIEYDMPTQINMWQRAGISTIIVTSGEILRYLVESVGKNHHNWLLEQQFVTISARIAQQALDYGWRNVTHTARADNASILATLRLLRDEQHQ